MPKREKAMKDFVLGFLTAQFLIFVLFTWKTLRNRRKALGEFDKVMEKVFADADRLNEEARALREEMGLKSSPKVDA
jgi:F0F1-type ATP synthase membrane subunit b/b'